MAAVVLAPGEFAVEHAGVDGGHLGGAVIFFFSKVANAEEAEGWTSGDGGHVAALLVEPVGVATGGNAVADEGRARGTEGDQLMCIDGKVASVFAAEGGFSGAVLKEVAGHPVVFAGGGEILDGFAEIAAVELGAARAGGADEHHGETRFEGHRDKGGFAEAGDAFDADDFRIYGGIGLEVIKSARGAPGPGAKRTPIIGFAGLTFVAQADDAFGETGAVIGLNAVRSNRGVTPTSGEELLGGGRIFERPAKVGETIGRLRGAGRTWHTATAEAAKHHEGGHGAFGIGRCDDCHLDFDIDRGKRGIVDVAIHRFAMGGNFPDEAVIDIRDDGPSDFGKVAGEATVNFAFEIFHDFRTALFPPHFSGGDAFAILEREQLRDIRKRIGFGGIVVGFVGRAGASAWPECASRGS